MIEVATQSAADDGTWHNVVARFHVRTKTVWIDHHLVGRWMAPPFDENGEVLP